MTAIWTAAEAADATGAKPAPGAGWAASGVSIDTRAVAANDLFVALKGPRFDGHDFVAAALSSGAAAAMVDRPISGADPARLLAVPDTMAGLEALAIAARARSQARIVAVTGSVGKTGTKEALATLLGAQGRTHASTGNLNNQIGMPLSLARMPATAEFGVFEIGMNHAGEIAPLSAMLRPHVAIITNVEAVHLEYFANVEGIADAKAEIFTGLDADGTAILNHDNPHFGRLTQAAEARGIGNIWSFGESAGAEGRLISVDLEPSGSVVRATILGREIGFRLPLPGRHQVQNALAVLLAVAAMGGDIGAAVATLETLTPVKGRGVAIDVALAGGSFRIVDETYNASPAATRAALAVLGMTEAGGRRLVALGDMLELGANGPAEHVGLADALIAAKVAQVFTAGPLTRHLHDALPAHMRGAHAETSAALAPLVARAARANDIVLVKGSAGSQMGTVVAALRARDNKKPSENRRAV
ncbi:MAG TPA: UDP-N-acetylmuramoylalanyl-D-glutamyl-2,6-diaminopimelate--D-alanyl-D-alanine ligase [Alphaproteobacteria bacterium]|jgi:UDP-N-acetylmuramoyl-tripeptide--D-alanyl-D-alanine ligase|nr:UDP-N-acetylmuramoylalanyl-D-glutamyl-2,6-diaminopimelate--D-alanyl-D-alanine ligase [Alphaproteobacteria bacterium]